MDLAESKLDTYKHPNYTSDDLLGNTINFE